MNLKAITKLINWFRSLLFRKPAKEPTTTTYEISTPVAPDSEPKFKATRAYADQRQKAIHNRRRKPTKTMRHLYKLG